MKIKMHPVKINQFVIYETFTVEQKMNKSMHVKKKIYFQNTSLTIQILLPRLQHITAS